MSRHKSSFEPRLKQSEAAEIAIALRDLGMAKQITALGQSVALLYREGNRALEAVMGPKETVIAVLEDDHKRIWKVEAPPVQAAEKYETIFRKYFTPKYTRHNPHEPPAASLPGASDPTAKFEEREAVLSNWKKLPAALRKVLISKGIVSLEGRGSVSLEVVFGDNETLIVQFGITRIAEYHYFPKNPRDWMDQYRGDNLKELIKYMDR